MNPVHEAAWAEAATWSLVPWVGAGVSRGLIHAGTGGPLVPDWRGFLTQAARSEGLDAAARTQVLDALAADQLEVAATLLHDGLATPVWHDLLRRTFEVRRSDAQEDGLAVLRVIWEVSQGLVITTNYDSTLLWGRSSSDPVPIVYDLRAPVDLSTLLRATPENPVLWQLHGSINYPDAIILEGADYERMYGTDPDASISSGGRARDLDAAHTSLRSIIASQSLLFLGTSLTDPRINSLLRSTRTLFPTPRSRHFMVCLEREVEQHTRQLAERGLSHITLLPIASFEELAGRLRSLRPSAQDVAAVRVTEIKWIRRRCRTVVAGGDEFVETLRPLLAETPPQHASRDLRDLLIEGDLSPFQRATVDALRNEFDSKIDVMVGGTTKALDNPAIVGLERANLLLFHAIGLEKLSRHRVPEAIAALDEVLAADIPEELRICADFNRLVCLEKLDGENPDFATYIHNRDFRFSSGELIWTKAWNMELVRCGRRGEEFRFGDLFEDALAAEIHGASTGFAKTLANWGHFSGGTIDDERVSQLSEIARRATPTQRVPILIYLATETGDDRFRDAINEALEESTGDTVDRLVQTKAIHGRYTLYGEYLMHSQAWGYVAPTPMSLSGNLVSQVGNPHPEWRAEEDDVLELVRRLGLRPVKGVSGDLPFGQGFASSTVLAMLHIGDSIAATDRRRVINVLDWISHGFEPSGLDHDSIAAQASGLYKSGNWMPAPSLPLDALFVRATGERTMSLRQTRQVVAQAAESLVPLAARLTYGIRDQAELDHEVFRQYCLVLRRLGVYTPEQSEYVDRATRLGLSAKAIGGLHRKAILVVGERDLLDAYADELPHGALLGRLDRDSA